MATISVSYLWFGPSNSFFGSSFRNEVCIGEPHTNGVGILSSSYSIWHLTLTRFNLKFSYGLRMYSTFYFLRSSTTLCPLAALGCSAAALLSWSTASYPSFASNMSIISITALYNREQHLSITLFRQNSRAITTTMMTISIIILKVASSEEAASSGFAASWSLFMLSTFITDASFASGVWLFWLVSWSQRLFWSPRLWGTVMFILLPCCFVRKAVR